MRKQKQAYYHETEKPASGGKLIWNLYLFVHGVCGGKMYKIQIRRNSEGNTQNIKNIRILYTVII